MIIFKIIEIIYAHIAHYLHIDYHPSMKIYFTCTTAEFSKYKTTYFKIRDFLVAQKHTLTRDWLAKAEKRLKLGDIEVEDIKEIYNDCMRAINAAELVIIEDTISNFSTGHQITVALQRQKPTLVLWQGKKHRHFKKMFIHGIDSDLLEVKEYNKDNLNETIKSFINKYKNSKTRNRFHLVLNQIERDYLDWAQYNKGESRTKIIRNSLKTTIDTDKSYNNYLKKK